MRAAINENPIVQIGLLGALGLIAAVFMLSRGGEPAVETTTPEATATADPAAAPVDPAAPAATLTPAPEAVSAEATPFEAGKGLPAPVVNAYESGDVVVLLVMQDGGIEDEPIEQDVRSLDGRGDTSVFVTDAKHVSEYSRIAEGVALDRVPAIIVLHPLENKPAGGEAPPMPEASVVYGFRGTDSVTQAVEDALYKGKSDTYAP